MRRPQRRLHLVMWLVLAPVIAAGMAAALMHAPADPAADLAGAVVTGEAR